MTKPYSLTTVLNRVRTKNASRCFSLPGKSAHHIGWFVLVLSQSLILPAVFSAPAFEYYQPLPDSPIIPKDNPQSEAKIQLGERLFFDERLSANSRISCNTCHNIFSGGDNDQRFGVGVTGKPSHRNPPTLLNIGHQTVLYWDGRSTSLENQAIHHISDPAIMGFGNHRNLARELAKDTHYPRMFRKAFGKKAKISIALVAKALASYQRTLNTPNSAFDTFIKGNKEALTPSARKGMLLFNEVGCIACHFGVNFAGPAPGPALGMGDGFYELFPNHLGSRFDDSHDIAKDLGRFYATKDPTDRHMWRVPPLRNIALGAPYFHNGSAKTLREAIVIMAKTQLQKELSEEEINNLLAFLNSLTGELPATVKKRALEHMKQQ